MEMFTGNICTFTMEKIISTEHSFNLTVQLCQTQNAMHVKNNIYVTINKSQGKTNSMPWLTSEAGTVVICYYTRAK